MTKPKLPPWAEPIPRPHKSAACLCDACEEYDRKKGAYIILGDEFGFDLGDQAYEEVKK